MPTNHIIDAMQFIVGREFDKAISLWRMYMRFRHYCTGHCGKLGMEPTTELCGQCLSDNLLYTAQQEHGDIRATKNNPYVRCSSDLDAWLNQKRHSVA